MMMRVMIKLDSRVIYNNIFRTPKYGSLDELFMEVITSLHRGKTLIFLMISIIILSHIHHAIQYLILTYKEDIGM